MWVGTSADRVCLGSCMFCALAYVHIVQLNTLFAGAVETSLNRTIYYLIRCLLKTDGCGDQSCRSHIGLGQPYQSSFPRDTRSSPGNEAG
jgi:hypothetical protein